ncbi:MAG: helix-turn-helix domain-containing protein [Alphaproteobacteria bacterium]|nr:helix-turn-helix domain-containing protein [Alphaproteobacteria bacterium]
MSVEAIAWAFQQTIPSKGAKLVLLSLANFANKERECWPSQRRIAADTGYSRQGLTKVLKQLEDGGWITRRKRLRKDGGTASCNYVLNIANTPANSVGRSTAETIEPMTPAGGTPCQPSTSPPCQPGASPLKNRNTEPSVDPLPPSLSEANASSREAPPSDSNDLCDEQTGLGTRKYAPNKEQDFTALAARDEVEGAVAQWNAMAERAGLARCEKITKKRRTDLSQRLRDCGGRSGWVVAITKVEESPFLCGDNDRGWRAGIDFLCRESSFTKLMEGSYDKSANGSGRSPRESETAMFRRLVAESKAHKRGLAGGLYD